LKKRLSVVLKGVLLPSLLVVLWSVAHLSSALLSVVLVKALLPGLELCSALAALPVLLSLVLRNMINLSNVCAGWAWAERYG
jgi:hypothetical protein